MAGEKVGGGLGIRGAGQLAGAFGSIGGGGRGNPPPEQGNPAVFSTPGTNQYGIPSKVTLVTIEQWSAGANGSSGAFASGGDGGGGGCYAKYTLGGALIVPGGVLTVEVGQGGNDKGGATATTVTSTGGSAQVYSNPGNVGGGGNKGGTNTITTGSGLTVITDTAGQDGVVHSTTTGGAGGAAGGPGGGAGGAGSTKGLVGFSGLSPGGGGGGGGGGPSFPHGGDGGDGKVVISHA